MARVADVATAAALDDTERSPPIDEVIKAGVVPRFVQFLQRGDSPQLQVCVYSVASPPQSSWSSHLRVLVAGVTERESSCYVATAGGAPEQG